MRAKGFGKALQETGKEAKGAKSASELKEVSKAVCGVWAWSIVLSLGRLLTLILLRTPGVERESVNPCK